MARFRNVNLVDELAIGLASGLSVAQWSQRHSVPVQTAHAWRRTTPGFKARVESHRKALVKRELELLADHAVLRSTTPADREAVRLVRPVRLLQTA